MNSGACFDSTGLYRYLLWRMWQPAADRLAIIMLNPSTADAQTNDATIHRCISFAQAWGYGGLEVVNLFAFKTSHPRCLKAASEPIGIDCDRYILQAVMRADCTVVAWGNWGKLHRRDQAVLNLLGNRAIYCLGLNQSKQPCHPLYLKRTVQPIPFESGQLNSDLQ
jgi:hypothetical protein